MATINDDFYSEIKKLADDIKDKNKKEKTGKEVIT